MFQRRKVERQAGGGNIEPPCDLARRKPVVTGRDQCTDEFQPRLIGKGGQGEKGFTLIHASITHELLN